MLFIATLAVEAQTINDVPLKNINVEYVQIVGTAKLFSLKLTIQIDFGQNVSFWSGQDEMNLKDETGKKIEFNSMIDALNFMSSNGYEFVNAYAITVQNQNVYHYLLRKKDYKVEKKN